MRGGKKTHGAGHDCEAQVLHVITLASQIFGIPHHWIIGRDRRAQSFQARAAAMAVARRWTGASYSVLGEIFGGRDHSTVLYAVNQVRVLCLRSPRFERRLAKLQRLVPQLAGRTALLERLAAAGDDAFSELALALVRAQRLDAARATAIVQALTSEADPVARSSAAPASVLHDREAWQ